jgi:hypothetical protein
MSVGSDHNHGRGFSPFVEALWSCFFFFSFFPFYVFSLLSCSPLAAREGEMVARLNAKLSSRKKVTVLFFKSIFDSFPISAATTL